MSAEARPPTVGRAIILPRRKRTAIPAWRDLASEIQAALGVVALANQSDLLAFSLNIGSGLLAKLTPGEAATRNLIRKRIADALKRRFKRKVPFILVLEADAGGRLHAHGILQLPYSEIGSARSALCVAGGTWTSGGTRFQADVQPARDPVGWWQYITKSLSRLPRASRAAWVAWSHPAKQEAKKLHGSARIWWKLTRDDLDIRHSFHYWLQLEDDLFGGRSAHAY